MTPWSRAPHLHGRRRACTSRRQLGARGFTVMSVPREGDVAEAQNLVASIRDGSFARAQVTEEVKNLRRSASSLQELTAVAKRSGDLGLWQQGLKVLEEAQELQLTPDMILYSAIMSGCEKSHQWQQVLALWTTATAALAPNSAAVTVALSALGRGSRWQEAIELGQSQQPNVFIQNAIISACERGQQWEQALGILESMRETDIVSFNAAMNACEKAHQWQAALQIFQSISLPPTEITMNTLMSACNRGSQWAAALQLLGEMTVRQLVPTLVSQTLAMAAGLKGSSWAAALQVYDQLPSSARERPAVRTMAMQALGEATAWPEALKLLQLQHRQTDQLCLNAAMRALELSGEWCQALQLLEEMVSLKRFQEVVPLTMAMGACKRAREWAAALWVLQDLMPALQIEPTVASMSTGLSALLQAGRGSHAWDLLQAPWSTSEG
ncbi:unnamed protein product [Durusdinium trenchii]|uniref:Pentatricopeptide repeat-containing protein, chloroplastic n=1 Tax=Durusdinium trenchii TaxID=1381693 RepID=A0ABP0S6B1_9DINO